MQYIQVFHRYWIYMFKMHIWLILDQLFSKYSSPQSFQIKYFLILYPCGLHLFDLGILRLQRFAINLYNCLLSWSFWYSLLLCLSSFWCMSVGCRLHTNQLLDNKNSHPGIFHADLQSSYDEVFIRCWFLGAIETKFMILMYQSIVWLFRI